MPLLGRDGYPQRSIERCRERWGEDYLRDNLKWNLSSHIQMLERENQRMRTELYDVDRVLGPPWLTAEARVERAKLLDAAYGQLLAIRHDLALHPSAEVRNAFEQSLA